MFKLSLPPRKFLPGAGLHLWWLNPIWPLAFMLLGTGFAAYIIPSSDFIENWKAPKFFGPDDMAFIIYSVAGFALAGGFVALASKPIPGLAIDRVLSNTRTPWPALWFLFYAGAALTVVAYVIWGALSFASGLTIGDIIAVFHNEPSAIYALYQKTETFPGVTTFTQLEMVVLIIGIVLAFKFGVRANFRRLVVPMGVIVGLAMVRSQFRHERIATLELAIPATVLILGLARSSKWPFYLKLLVGLGPVFGPILLYLFFSSAEYSRSWVNFYQGRGDSSFFWFSFVRLIGYYVTALNNGAAFVQTIGQYNVPFHTFEWFWRFPLTKEFFHYDAPTHAEPWDDYEDILKLRLNPELNNPSGVFVVELDYGFFGGILAWSLAGVAGMMLYRSFLKGSLPGLLIYPFYYIGLLESPRILYWTMTRAFPSWLLLLVVMLVLLFTAVGNWQKRKSAVLVPHFRFRPRSIATGRFNYRRAIRRVL